MLPDSSLRLLTTDPFQTEDRRALRTMVTAFTHREIVPSLKDWEEAGQLPRAVHRAAAEAGLLGIGFPEELGGSGGDLIDIVVMTEAMLEAGASGGVISALFTHGISLPHVVDEHDRRLAAGDESGAAYLAESIIAPVLAGEMILSLGVSEPDGGSDVARIRTTAERRDSGWSVTGTKTYITSAVRADRVVTAVRTPEAGDGAAGITLMILDPSSPGYAPPRPLKKMGWWCSDTAELAFEAVPVADRDVLGVGQGFASLARHFVTERLSIAVTAYATAQRSLNLAIEWARDRETFGRALSSRQVIRHLLVDMHRRTDVARTYARSIAMKHVAGEPCVVEAALAKQTAVEAADFVVDRAVQIHGGMGYMRGVEVEMHYRDVRVLGIGGGATEVMTDLAARLLNY